MKLYSPFTGDLWDTPQTAVGALSGIALAVSETIDLPEALPEIILKSVDVARAIAGLRQLNQTGSEGVQLSNAYWTARDVIASVSSYTGQSPNTLYGIPSLTVDDDHPSYAVGRMVWLTMTLATRVVTSRDTPDLELLVEHVVTSSHAALLGVFEGNPQIISDAERRWRFICCAGRLPTPADADLLLAFEAALTAEAIDYAHDLSKL